MDKNTNRVQNIILIIIAIGVWVLIFQNVGSKKIHGRVDVGNTIDINIQEINGQSNVFYQGADGNYMLLPVSSR